jgi:hypothetical protein
MSASPKCFFLTGAGRQRTPAVVSRRGRVLAVRRPYKRVENVFKLLSFASLRPISALFEEIAAVGALPRHRWTSPSLAQGSRAPRRLAARTASPWSIVGRRTLAPFPPASSRAPTGRRCRTRRRARQLAVGFRRRPRSRPGEPSMSFLMPLRTSPTPSFLSSDFPGRRRRRGLSAARGSPPPAACRRSPRQPPPQLGPPRLAEAPRWVSPRRRPAARRRRRRQSRARALLCFPSPFLSMTTGPHELFYFV